MRHLALVAATLALLAGSVGAHAAQLPDSFAKLRAQDALVQRVGYRLATGNAALCPDTVPATGLLLHDLATYSADYAAALRAGLGLDGPVAVEGVVPGSPAAGAGLALDDTLLAVDDRLVADFPLDRARSWERVGHIEEAIAGSLREDGHATLSVSHGGTTRTVALTGTPACATRFEVAPFGGKAAAEGTRVVIGQDFVGFSYPEEEFAAALAHELAHNILRHRALLEATGRSTGNTRETEREADRMMPWLLANAGYDPFAAVRFMQRFGPGHDGGIFREPTHDGWSDRAEALAVEAHLVALTQATTGAADWRNRFAAQLARSAALPSSTGGSSGSKTSDMADELE